MLGVQEVVTHFIQLAYYIKWVTTSWTYCITHVTVQTSVETAVAAGTAVLHDNGGQLHDTGGQLHNDGGQLHDNRGHGPEDASASKPEVGSDRADSGFGSSGSSQKSISPPDMQVPTISCISFQGYILCKIPW